jgi:hypothetical protein
VDTDLHTLATALFVKTDDLLKSSPQLSDAELVTLAMGGGLHTGRMRPFQGDGQAFRPGRMGSVRLLRQSRALLLGLRLHLVCTLGGLPIAFALTWGEGRQTPDPLRQVIESINETF